MYLWIYIFFICNLLSSLLFPQHVLFTFGRLHVSMSLEQPHKYTVPAMSSEVSVTEKMTGSYRSMTTSSFPYSLLIVSSPNTLAAKSFLLLFKPISLNVFKLVEVLRIFSFNRYNLQWCESNSPDCFHPWYRVSPSNAEHCSPRFSAPARYQQCWHLTPVRLQLPAWVTLPSHLPGPLPPRTWVW